MDIQVYATTARVEGESNDSLNVTLQGVEMGNLIQQLNANDVLEVMDIADITKFITDYLAKD